MKLLYWSSCFTKHLEVDSPNSSYIPFPLNSWDITCNSSFFQAISSDTRHQKRFIYLWGGREVIWSDKSELPCWYRLSSDLLHFMSVSLPLTFLVARPNHVLWLLSNILLETTQYFYMGLCEADRHLLYTSMTFTSSGNLCIAIIQSVYLGNGCILRHQWSNFKTAIPHIFS